MRKSCFPFIIRLFHQNALWCNIYFFIYNISMYLIKVFWFHSFDFFDLLDFYCNGGKDQTLQIRMCHHWWSVCHYWFQDIGLPLCWADAHVPNSRSTSNRSPLVRISYFLQPKIFASRWPVIHTTLLLALPAERVQQVLRLQVGSSERKVQVVFVISLDVSVIPSN